MVQLLVFNPPQNSLIFLPFLSMMVTGTFLRNILLTISFHIFFNPWCCSLVTCEAIILHLLSFRANALDPMIRRPEHILLPQHRPMYIIIMRVIPERLVLSLGQFCQLVVKCLSYPFGVMFFSFLIMYTIGGKISILTFFLRVSLSVSGFLSKNLRFCSQILIFSLAA